MDIQTIIRKHALKNAYDYGSANTSSVVGKVIAEIPESKKDMKNTMKIISMEINRITKLSKEEIANEMKSFEYIEKKEEKKSIQIPNAIEGKVLTRFPPEPSGYPHIGHAKAAWLDYEAANNYGGKMILRFDDTNPEKESYSYVEAIKDGLNWLGIPYPKETYTSDNMQAIYLAAQKLINKNKAYACSCNQEEMSKGRTESIACSCRTNSIEKNLQLWNRMIDREMDEGSIVLRYKGDLESQNTVMRDPTLARILKTKHFRQLEKFSVWPSYDLAVCVMDHLEGITHSMRSKEYELRDELYFAIFDDLGWNRPNLIGFSRLNIKNAPISKRLLLPLVKENKVLGWDDPRLPTLKGLERRGILPSAVKEFVLSFGLSKVESEPSWEALLVLNRKLLDPKSNHYFFVADPIEIELVGKFENRTIELPVHPKLDNGKRKIEVGKKLFISSSDAQKINVGDIFRLKDLSNLKLNKKEKNKMICEYSEKSDPQIKVQWVSEQKIDTTILIPKDLLDENGEFDPESLQKINGYSELDCLNLKVGDIIQFERFGFCRLDKKDKDKLQFVYSC